MGTFPVSGWGCAGPLPLFGDAGPCSWSPLSPPSPLLCWGGVVTASPPVPPHLRLSQGLCWGPFFGGGGGREIKSLFVCVWGTQLKNLRRHSHGRSPPGRKNPPRRRKRKRRRKRPPRRSWMSASRRWRPSPRSRIPSPTCPRGEGRAGGCHRGQGGSPRAGGCHRGLGGRLLSPGRRGWRHPGAGSVVVAAAAP